MGLGAILSNLFSSSLGFGGRRGKPRVVGIVAPLSISALNGQPSKSTADTMNTAAVAKLTLTSSPQESLRCGRDGFMKEVDEAIQKYQKRCSKPSWLPLSASPPQELFGSAKPFTTNDNGPVSYTHLTLPTIYPV